MASQLEVPAPGEFIYSEDEGTYSRENVIIASGSGVVPAGRVLGLVTASSKYSHYRSDNTPAGVSTVRGILYAEVDATSADQPAVMMARSCEVVNSRVTTQVAGDKAASVTGLAALSPPIISR